MTTARSGSNGNNTALLPPDYRELYVVVTEGRQDLFNLARGLRRRLKDVLPNGEGTVLTADNAFNAVRISRIYGHVPLVLMIGNKGEEGQAFPVHGFVRSAYENLADVHNAFVIRVGNLEYKTVTELGYDSMEAAIETVLWEREQNVLPTRTLKLKKEPMPSLDELVTAIERQFNTVLDSYPSISRSAVGIQPRVIKIGGSMYDLIETREGADAFNALVESLADLIKRNEYNIIITVGGGPFYDPTKQAIENLTLSSGQERSLARMSFRQQAETLIGIFSQMGVQAQRIEDTKLLQAVESIVKSGSPLPYVPVVLRIPESYPNARYTVPPERSDELAVALADLFHEPNVIFIKDTASVYMRDINLTPEQVRALPQQFQGHNTRLVRVYSDHILAGQISRVGPDGKDQHLVENTALRAMQNSLVVGSIQVVNGRDSKSAIEAITTTEPIGSYILNQNVSPTASSQ
ncbi:hypothetical protein HYU16_00035 [Candidatus Woesearchaeota archaeon]|nr:hypothetical protein [Candidatus Woesearchaeota archaeon]